MVIIKESKDRITESGVKDLNPRGFLNVMEDLRDNNLTVFDECILTTTKIGTFGNTGIFKIFKIDHREIIITDGKGGGGTIKLASIKFARISEKLISIVFDDGSIYGLRFKQAIPSQYYT